MEKIRKNKCKYCILLIIVPLVTTILGYTIESASAGQVSIKKEIIQK
jgi:hypothetical protein